MPINMQQQFKRAKEHYFRLPKQLKEKTSDSTVTSQLSHSPADEVSVFRHFVTEELPARTVLHENRSVGGRTIVPGTNPFQRKHYRQLQQCKSSTIITIFIVSDSLILAFVLLQAK